MEDSVLKTLLILEAVMNSEFSVVIYILVLLCSHENEKLNSVQISKRINVNPTRIRRLLGSIKNAGYVKTKDGIDGGIHCPLIRLKSR